MILQQPNNQDIRRNTPVFIVLFFISTLLSFTIRKDVSSAQEFSFSIKEATSSFNSKTGIYTRKYLDKDSSVKVTFDKNEIQLIRDMIINLNFKNFPREFKCSKFGPFTQPSFTTTIEVLFDGKLKVSTNTTLCDKKTQQKMARNFDKIAGLIHKILDSKKEIKQMESSDIIFE